MKINERQLRKIIREALNNFTAPLYHNTEMINLLSMMETDSIKSNGIFIGYKKQREQGICFTRDKKYRPFPNLDVRMTFDANEINKRVRGMKMKPMQEPWIKIDEYEERIISTNNKPFEINHLTDIVTEVLIILDRTCFKNTRSMAHAKVNLLRNIMRNNIFGDKLKIIDSLKTMNEMTLEDACNRILNPIWHMPETEKEDRRRPNGKLDSLFFTFFR